MSEVECSACHVDPHEGRFAAGGARPAAGGCTACHGDRGFRPSTVDVAAHQNYGFRLEGAHQAVPCAACHEESRRAPLSSTLVRSARGVSRLAFTATSVTCASCHDSPHENQFADRTGDCTICHDVAGFRPAGRFDHNRDARFKLEGAHAEVSCEKCHTSRKTAQGRDVVQYRGIPAKCEACHLEAPRETR
jgi:hypothetical protein